MKATTNPHISIIIIIIIINTIIITLCHGITPAASTPLCSRWKWTHGTRLGVQLPGEAGLHDWWGRKQDVMRRGPERHSVVFAFAAGREEGGKGAAAREKGGQT